MGTKGPTLIVATDRPETNKITLD